MDRVDIRTMPLLARRDSVKVLETPSNGHYALPMQSNIAPFDNNDVRLALKYGIEREAFLKTIMGGHGTLGNDHCVSQIQRFYAKELEQRRYDPDKAKYHLRQAGMQTIQVPLHTANAVFNGAVDAAVLFKEHAEKAGIMIDVVREPNDGYWSNVWRKKPWIMSYTSSRPVEDMYMTLAYSANSPWNESAWNHPLFNKILVEARVEANESKRREMYVQLQKILRDEGGTVIPAYYNFIIAMNKNVQHGALAGNWDMDGYKALERWWFN
jgi:peptide/nickel transport system substrate-binding protein